MARFDVIHVSDFHFGRRDGRPNLATLASDPRGTIRAGEVMHSIRALHRQATHDPALAIQVARFLIERVEPGSLLLMSGDIAATGLVDDLDVGLHFLEAPSGGAAPHLDHRLRPTIAAGNFDVCVVPGNHDRYANHIGWPGCRNFDAMFSRYWGQIDPLVGCKVVEDPESGAKLAVVAADMCLRFQDMSAFSLDHYGHGRATPEVVGRLEAATTEVRRLHDGVGVCWMLHFPPAFADGDVPTTLRLENDDLVVDAAVRAGVRLILAGHTHVSAIRDNGQVTVACAGSATFYMQAGGHYIHHLEIDVTDGDATLSTRTDYRWNTLRAEFAPL